MTRLLSTYVGIILLACATRWTAAGTYNFESMPLGPMTATDGWYQASNRSVVEQGYGINTSHVYDSVNNQGALYVPARRFCIAGFGLPTPRAGDLLRMSLDFRVASSVRTEAGFYFGLFDSHTDSGMFWPIMVGLQHQMFSSTEDRLLVPRYDGGAVANGYTNFNHVRGDWYHVEGLIDFTRSRVTQSMFIQDLTAGESLHPVSALQNIDLMLNTSDVASQNWDAVYLAAGNMQLDNLTIALVPEPGAALRFCAAMLVLGFRPRRWLASFQAVGKMSLTGG